MIQRKRRPQPAPGLGLVPKIGIALAVIGIAVGGYYTWEKEDAADAKRLGNDLLFAFRKNHTEGDFEACLRVWQQLHDQLGGSYLFGFQVDRKSPAAFRDHIADRMRQRLSDEEHFRTLLEHLYTGRTAPEPVVELLAACGLESVDKRWKKSCEHYAMCRAERVFTVHLPAVQAEQILVALQEKLAGEAVLVAASDEAPPGTIGSIRAGFVDGGQIEYTEVPWMASAPQPSWRGPQTRMVPSWIELVFEV